MPAFKVGDRVHYPASGPGVTPAHGEGNGRVASVHPLNDGSSYVYGVSSGGVLGQTFPGLFKEAELSLMT